ncbi:MAG: hypothetical protein CK553_01635 [Opitutia bacterium]|nr:MAG: hypothetical protein CK553_01635 [Opitutae bacterium]
MRLLSCLALVITSAVLPAQDFDFKGVPADYAIVFATASSRGLKISDSPEAKAFKARMEKAIAGIEPSAKDSKEMQEAIKAATGIDLESPDNRIAGGVSLGAAGQMSGGLIVRARHDSKKLSAHAVGKKVSTLQAGATKGWNGQELLASLSDELAKAAKDFPAPVTAAGAPASEPIGVFDLDDNTLVIAQPKEAARIIDLLKGKGVSYALNASLRPQVNATGRPYAVFAMNAAKLPATPELTDSGFQGAIFAMGENGSNQIMKISALFTSKEKADRTAMQAQGMLAMAPMMLAGDPSKPETAEEKEMNALAAEFLAGVQPVEAAGNQVTLTAKWDTLKLFGMLEKIVAIGATKAKAAPQPLTK